MLRTVVPVVLIPLIQGCGPGTEKKLITVGVQAEDFTDSSGAVRIDSIGDDAQVVNSMSENTWLAYNVAIPMAGRYRCEVRFRPLSGKMSGCRVEDYYDNTDNRFYDITGRITIPAAGEQKDFIVAGKDGSPLDTGIHKMKLHIEDDSMQVDWIRFTLMKKHQMTPRVLTQRTAGENWERVWSDEFDGQGLPDTSTWTFDIGNWGWGNNESQYYTEFRSENARQENGNLIIEARKKDMGYDWTSARLTTRGKVSFVYGRIEFRAKVPAGDGCWAAVWLLGDAYRDEISWPYCGEIDVLETTGREIDDETGDGLNHASCHNRAFYFKLGNHISSVIEVKNMTEEYHTYSIEWMPDRIDAFLDDEKYYTYDKTNGEWEWPYNNPQNIIINLAMGGGMGGAIDPGMSSAKLILDYMRVYELR